MTEPEQPQLPAAPDFSRENLFWARAILISCGLIFGVLLVSLALPAIRERFL